MLMYLLRFTNPMGTMSAREGVRLSLADIGTIGDL